MLQGVPSTPCAGLALVSTLFRDTTSCKILESERCAARPSSPWWKLAVIFFFFFCLCVCYVCACEGESRVRYDVDYACRH